MSIGSAVGYQLLSWRNRYPVRKPSTGGHAPYAHLDITLIHPPINAGHF